MERESGRNHNTNTTSIHSDHQQQQQRQNRERLGTEIGDTIKITSSSSPDFVLQWGNRKRLRCMKIQIKQEPSGSALRTTAQVDRHVIIGDFTKQQRPASFPRNSEAMRGSTQGHVNNGAVEHVKMLNTQEGKRVSPPSASNNHIHKNDSDSLEMAHEEAIKKGTVGGGSTSGSEVIRPVAWPATNFVIALTNKEKEEDFMAIKGSKLPQRPRKRSKYVQRNLKLVSPGAWLCELTLDRYEVREKKTSEKRPRGLKAMCNNNNNSMESDSE